MEVCTCEGTPLLWHIQKQDGSWDGVLIHDVKHFVDGGVCNWKRGCRDDNHYHCLKDKEACIEQLICTNITDAGTIQSVEGFVNESNQTRYVVITDIDGSTSVLGDPD